MKIIILLFLFLAGCQTLSLARVKNISQDTIKSKYELDSLSRAEYEKFETKFSTWFYKKYCVKMKIKISCGGCSSFFFPVTFKVDSAGKIKITETGTGKFCGKELNARQKSELLKGLNNIVFSNLFYGKIIVFNFNRSLKC
ncbi:MAG: hypothetical protein IAF38_22495 [Bacteroidia bacterium]|nr:hypothetical protein [Bacteroidia bacterium]